jgi:hypothetical protein
VRSGAISDPTGTTTPATFATRAHFEQDNEYEVDAAPSINPPDARFDVSSTRDTLFWEKWFWMAWMLLAVAVRTSQAEQRSGAQAMASEPAALRWHDSPVRSAPRARLP